ncbi:MAG: hypothetical protein DRQ01_09495 [Ignavibacteriae bacterium]|nr:MAG: hypothetical protein DRQ01_09495 [Ignavibacteriota bacterium]
MKKLFVLTLALFSIGISSAQTELKATMGINFISIPSVQDYINQCYQPIAEVGSFSSAVIFTVEAGQFLSSNFEMGLEIPYQIYSYNSNIGLGQYDLTYNSILPSVMAYYALVGDGYNFKIGGGVGPRFVSVKESKKWIGSEVDYSSTGFGIVVRAEGNTVLSENLYANIGVDIRYDVNGEPSASDGNTITNNVLNENVNFDSFAVGVKLGISYLFGVAD